MSANNSNLPAATQRRTLDHNGSTVGGDNVTTIPNDSATRHPILQWTGPRMFESITYRGRTHYTKLELRYKQTATFADDDGSAALEAGERTINLNGDLQPVAGEKVIDDQPMPVLVAYNVTQGTEIEPADLTLDYAANTVEVADSAVAIDDDVAVWPLIQTGTVQYRGRNQFGQIVGPAERWGTPVYRFSDFDMNKQDTEIHMQGYVQFRENEILELTLESDLTVVWSDADYPHGSSPSTVEQAADVDLG